MDEYGCKDSQCRPMHLSFLIKRMQAAEFTSTDHLTPILLSGHMSEPTRESSRAAHGLNSKTIEEIKSLLRSLTLTSGHSRNRSCYCDFGDWINPLIDQAEARIADFKVRID